MKAKDDITPNPGAQSFQAGEQLHTRSAHSTFAKYQLKMQNETTCLRGKQERASLEDAERQAGGEVGGFRTAMSENCLSDNLNDKNMTVCVSQILQRS